MIRLFVAGVLALSGMATLGAAQEPALPDVLSRAADYVSTYRSKVSGVSLEEAFILTSQTPGLPPVPKRVSSDLVLLNLGERLIGLRDPFAVDGNALRERKPRVITRLTPPTMAAWSAVQAYSQENDNQFVANVVLWYNDPVFALQFVEKRHQPGIIYKLDGKKKINNVQVVGIGYKEKQEKDKKYLFGTPGNPSSSGRIWVEPATGAIYQIELWVQSESDTVRSEIRFALDEKLGMVLPREATHRFEWRGRGTGISNVDASASGERMSFDGSVKYSNPIYTPIDLAKMMR